MSDMQPTPTLIKPGPLTHMTVLLIIAAVTAFTVWAYFGKLDEATMVIGEVVPSGQVKRVQHLEGGIVREILVNEGAPVRAGQSLLTLEPTASAADTTEVRVQLASLLVDVARLEAEANNAETPTFSAEIMAEHADLVRDAQDHFQSRRDHRQTLLQSRQEEVVLRQRQIQEFSTRIANKRKELALLQEQIEISERLRKSELSTRMKHLTLLKEAAALQGVIDDSRAALAQARSQLKSAELQVTSTAEGFQREIRKELEEKRRRAEEVASRLTKAEDSLQRTVLKSPVDGVVKTLYISTTGGVVAPGGTVMDIVPSDESLVIEGRMPPQEIVHVKPGQTATIQLASADAIRFGKIEGEVMQVSPDTVKTEDGTSYYKVRIETKSAYFTRQGEHYTLVPGVKVMCSIRTGSRNVLSYILAPFLTSTELAFKER